MTLVNKIVQILKEYNSNVMINEVKRNENVINTQLMLNDELLVEVNKKSEITIHDAFIRNFLSDANIVIDEFIELHNFNEFYNNLVINKLQGSFEINGLTSYDISKVYNVYTSVLLKGDSVNSLRFVTDKMPVIKQQSADVYEKEYVEKAFIVFDTNGAKYAVEVNHVIVKNKQLAFALMKGIMKEFDNGGAFGLQELMESPGGLDDFSKMFGGVALE